MPASLARPDERKLCMIESTNYILTGVLCPGRHWRSKDCTYCRLEQCIEIGMGMV